MTREVEEIARSCDCKPAGFDAQVIRDAQKEGLAWATHDSMLGLVGQDFGWN